MAVEFSRSDFEDILRGVLDEFHERYIGGEKDHTFRKHKGELVNEVLRDIEEEYGTCPSCGGSGGGDPPWQCIACMGSGNVGVDW